MAKLTREQVEQIIKEARKKGESPDLMEVDLGGTDLSGMDLSGIDFRGANLEGANLREVKLGGANLSGAKLEGANLTRARLLGAWLLETDLYRAILVNVHFGRANLDDADLIEADLRGAKFWGTNLSGVDLSEANLSGAELLEANLSEAYVDGADLSEVRIRGITFGDIDLSKVLGLDTVKHQGPSTIGIDTLQLSRGKIPEVFLRGCGLSDWEIEIAKLYTPNLSPKQIEVITNKIYTFFVERTVHYSSCFISYSHRDKEFARQLHDDLQNNGVRCWFAPEDMKIGDQIRSTIDHSIRSHDKLLLILSYHSVISDWVETEVEKAFAEERRRKQTILFPIHLDDAAMHSCTAWVTDIRETRHIGDFSRWSDSAAYQRGLERLLRDLQVGAETPPSLPARFATPDSTRNSLRRQLARHHTNLNKLREDAAIYGAGEVPLRLQNQIEAEQKHIAEIEAELRAIEMEPNQ